MSEDILTTLKIIVVGSIGVGKTSILSQLVEKDFSIQKPTLRPEYYFKKYQFNGKPVRLALWDTAGQERFNSMPSMLYRDVQGAVLVYDVTDYKSFKDLHRWLTGLENYYEGLEKQPIITILGNKIDMDGREVQRHEGLSFARRHTALFLETSAKTREGVDTAFDDLVTKIMETPGLWKRDSESKAVCLQANSSSDQYVLPSCVRCWS